MDEIKNKKFISDVKRLNRIFNNLKSKKINHNNKIVQKHLIIKNTNIVKINNTYSPNKIKRDNYNTNKPIIKNIELDYLNFSKINLDDYKINKSFDDDFFSSPNYQNLKKKLASLRYIEKTNSFFGESKANISIYSSQNYDKENIIKESSKTPSTICNYYTQSKIATTKKLEENPILLDNNSNVVNNKNEKVLKKTLKMKLNKRKQSASELSRKMNLKRNKMKNKNKKIKNIAQLIKYKLKKNENYQNKFFIHNKTQKNSNFAIFLLNYFKNPTINNVNRFYNDKNHNVTSEKSSMINEILTTKLNSMLNASNFKKNDMSFLKNNNVNKPLYLRFDKIKYERYFNQNNTVIKKSINYFSSKNMKIKKVNPSFLNSKNNLRINTNSIISESSSLFYLKNRSTVNTSKNNNKTKIIINQTVSKEHNLNVTCNKNKVFQIKKILPSKKQITPKNKIPKCNKNMHCSTLNKKLFVNTSDHIITILNEGFTENKNSLKNMIPNNFTDSRPKKFNVTNKMNDIKQKLFYSNIYNTQNKWRKNNDLKKCKYNYSLGKKKISFDQLNNLVSIEESVKVKE